MRDLEQHFNNMYDKFKLMLYDRALKERGSSSPGDLSLQEVIYMEIIIALGSPTVAEFSRYSKKNTALYLIIFILSVTGSKSGFHPQMWINSGRCWE